MILYHNLINQFNKFSLIKFADIQFELSPVDADFEGEELQFINEIKGGNIPRIRAGQIRLTKAPNVEVLIRSENRTLGESEPC